MAYFLPIANNPQFILNQYQEVDQKPVLTTELCRKKLFFSDTDVPTVESFIFQRREYLCNITYGIFFDIPRIFLEHEYILCG